MEHDRGQLREPGGCSSGRRDSRLLRKPQAKTRPKYASDWRKSSPKKFDEAESTALQEAARPVSSVETMAYLRLDGELNVDVTDFQANLVLHPCIHSVVCSGLRILSMSKHCKGVVEETTTVVLKLEASNCPVWLSH